MFVFFSWFCLNDFLLNRFKTVHWKMSDAWQIKTNKKRAILNWTVRFECDYFQFSHEEKKWFFFNWSISRSLYTNTKLDFVIRFFFILFFKLKILHIHNIMIRHFVRRSIHKCLQSILCFYFCYNCLSFFVYLLLCFFYHNLIFIQRIDYVNL